MTSRQGEQQSRRAEERRRVRSSPCPSPPTVTPKAPLILVVDDQEHLCWVLQKVLSEAGYCVQTARTGKEALQACVAREVAVAIIDYRLPDMTGIKLFHQLNGTSCLPVGILITSYGSPKLRAEALAAGFSAYFDKPLSHQKLLECLDGVTARVREND